MSYEVQPAEPAVRKILATAAICAVFLSACSSDVHNAPRVAETPAARTSLDDKAEVINNMAANQDDDCLGISAVVEALLEGEPQQCPSGEDVDDFALRIFENLDKGDPLTFCDVFMLDHKEYRCFSREAILALSKRVSRSYKAEFARISQTEEGRKLLSAAQLKFVETEEELDRILENDSDGIAVFCARGKRIFPDQKTSEMNHAFLIGKSEKGQLFALDANDPGHKVPMTLSSGKNSLIGEWSCKYARTGELTTQQCYLIRANTYFEFIRKMPGSSASVPNRPER